MDSKYDAEIYVDGSYNIKNKNYAYGMMIVDSKGEHYFSRAFPEDSKSSMRNVAGEIAGAQAGMQYAIDNNLKNVNIIYDYAGIEAWCSGSWRAKNCHTQQYKAFFDEASKKINIDFTHVKGHSGIEGNEICDALAKSALGLPDTAERRQKYKPMLDSAGPYLSNQERITKQAKLSAAASLGSQGVISDERTEYQR